MKVDKTTKAMVPMTFIACRSGFTIVFGNNYETRKDMDIGKILVFTYGLYVPQALFIMHYVHLGYVI